MLFKELKLKLLVDNLLRISKHLNLQIDTLFEVEVLMNDFLQ